MLKIRRPLGRLIFNMGIAIPGKTVFLIETAPRYLVFSSRLLYLQCIRKGYHSLALSHWYETGNSLPTSHLFEISTTIDPNTGLIESDDKGQVCSKRCSGIGDTQASIAAGLARRYRDKISYSRPVVQPSAAAGILPAASVSHQALSQQSLPAERSETGLGDSRQESPYQSLPLGTRQWNQPPLPPTWIGTNSTRSVQPNHTVSANAQPNNQTQPRKQPWHHRYLGRLISFEIRHHSWDVSWKSMP